MSFYYTHNEKRAKQQKNYIFFEKEGVYFWSDKKNLKWSDSRVDNFLEYYHRVYQMRSKAIKALQAPEWRVNKSFTGCSRGSLGSNYGYTYDNNSPTVAYGEYIFI